MQLKALVIEDDAVARELLAGALRELGLQVVTAESVETGRPRLDAGVHLLFLDLQLPGLSGDVFIDELQRTHPAVPIVVVTADDSLRRAVETMRRGAHDYLPKPLAAAQLEAVVHRAGSEAKLRHEVYRLRRELGRREGLPGVIGTAPAMRRMFERIRKAAPSRISVAFLGESGTGKEVLARALHQESPRSAGPFIALNCAAVPRDLLESQLFGHRKGAFTGALDDQPGHFVLADGGTLFLDEIGEMDPALQSKLLRALEDRMLRPIGSDREIEVDVRIVSATNSNLKERVAEGTFREDLYYRVVAFPIEIPPLRDRAEDVPALAFHFLAKHRMDAGRPRIDTITPEAVEVLKRHPWPGNVRQLENVIHQALLLTSRETTIGIEALPPDVLAAPAHHVGHAHHGMPNGGVGTHFLSGLHDPETGKMLPLREIEDRAFRLALEEADGNTTRAAKTLGVARATFYRRLGPKRKVS